MKNSILFSFFPHLLFASKSLAAIMAAFIFAVSNANAEEVKQGSILASHQELAQKIFTDTGVTGGLIVHIGCGDGALTAALGEDNGFVVQGFDQDQDQVRTAEKLFRGLGLNKRVSAHHLGNNRLPYAEEMVNLLVVSGDNTLARAELERVLVPGGALFTLQDGAVWKKPVPPELDDWSHWLHDAGQSGVSRDTRVGPPRRLKWVVEPLYSRGHEYASSVGALVSAAGRIFYVVDEGQTGNYELPSRCVLIAREAFNGLELWRKPMPHWIPASAKGGFDNFFQPERLTTDGKHLFLAMGENRELSVLGTAAGNTIKSFPDINGVGQILADNSILLVQARLPNPSKEHRVVAIDIPTWTILWSQTFADLAGTGLWSVTNAGLTYDGQLVYLQSGETLLALDAKTGAQAWVFDLGKIEPVRSYQTRLLRDLQFFPAVVRAAEGKLLVSAGKRFYALAPETGAKLWEKDDMEGWYWNRVNFFAVNGKLYETNKYNYYDFASGEQQGKIDVSSIFSRGHHPRCYPPKATVRYIIANNRGAEFISLDGKDMSANDYLRGNCGLGVVPANGLLYLPPNQCFCYSGVMQPGFKAMASAAGNEPQPLSPDAPERLNKGPAYGRQQVKVAVAKQEVSANSSWPTYRGGGSRRSAITSSVVENLGQKWEFDGEGRITPPVAAEGLVLFANQDTRSVIALDHSSGKEKWRFSAEGVIDSPPTIGDGRVYFGSADGQVYCLSAVDGELMWKFLAAPRQRWIHAFGGIQSAWPVSGSVLLHNGLLYFTAGRNTWIDGGIHAYALDPSTGAVAHYRHLRDGIFDETEKPYVPAFHIEGARNDLLVAATDSDRIFLGPLELNSALEPQPNLYGDRTWDMKDAIELRNAPFVDREAFDKLDPDASVYTGAQDHPRGALGNKRFGGHRVLATGGFLDASLFNRTYWMYGDIWPGFYKANFAANTGQLLAVDEDNTYAAKLYHRGTSNMHSPVFLPGNKGVLLQADANTNQPVLDPRTWGRDKRLGYGRKEPPVWFHWIPVLVNAMVVTDRLLFVAGAPDVFDRNDPCAAFEGRAGALMQIYNKKTGDKEAEITLPFPPVFDGMIATEGGIIFSGIDGRIRCYERNK